MTKLLATLAFFFPALLAAQKYDHQWPFGYGTNLPLQFGISLLDFNGGQVSVAPFAQNIAEIGTTPLARSYPSPTHADATFQRRDLLFPSALPTTGVQILVPLPM